MACNLKPSPCILYSHGVRRAATYFNHEIDTLIKMAQGGRRCGNAVHAVNLPDLAGTVAFALKKAEIRLGLDKNSQLSQKVAAMAT